MHGTSLVETIKAVYRLDKESAVHLMRFRSNCFRAGNIFRPPAPGSTEGKLAAITLKDLALGSWRGSGPPYRASFRTSGIFGTVGGLGQSIVLQTEDVEGSVIDAPVIDHARFAVERHLANIESRRGFSRRRDGEPSGVPGPANAARLGWMTKR